MRARFVWDVTVPVYRAGKLPPPRHREGLDPESRRGGAHGPERSPVVPRPLRPDGAHRRLVAGAARDDARARRVRRLRDLGGVPGSALFLGALHLAVLFAGDLRRLAALVVRAAALVVAGLADLLARAPDPVGAGRL